MLNNSINDEKGQISLAGGEDVCDSIELIEIRQAGLACLVLLGGGNYGI
ncbi:MAG: hypothetical protein WC238_00060 [Parcubacteria group bacterium]